jgi:hypothetical protein
MERGECSNRSGQHQQIQSERHFQYGQRSVVFLTVGCSVQEPTVRKTLTVATEALDLRVEAVTSVHQCPRRPAEGSSPA